MVLLNFAEIILHTIIVYLKECERKQKGSVLLKFKQVKIKAEELVAEMPLSTRLNYFLGRKLFPMVFLFCTLLYILEVLAHNKMEHSKELPENHDCKNE